VTEEWPGPTKHRASCSILAVLQHKMTPPPLHVALPKQGSCWEKEPRRDTMWPRDGSKHKTNLNTVAVQGIHCASIHACHAIPRLGHIVIIIIPFAPPPAQDLGQAWVKRTGLLLMVDLR
jgi:hypothetical protein